MHDIVSFSYNHPDCKACIKCGHKVKPESWPLEARFNYSVIFERIASHETIVKGYDE